VLEHYRPSTVPHITSMTLPLGPMTHMETSTFFDVVFPDPEKMKWLQSIIINKLYGSRVHIMK